LARDFEPAIRVIRGDGIDAVHCAAIAVVDRRSRLTHRLGDPKQPFFARSALKPLQALPLVRSGACEHYGFGPREIALACASHNGTDEQRSVVESMLARLGLDASALGCGTEIPIGRRLRAEAPRAGADDDPLRHNCSGKHAGFLAVSRMLGQPAASYLDPEGPTQQAVRRAVAEGCELDPDQLGFGIDGCSAPNFALPLHNLALGFKNLAASAAGGYPSIRASLLAEPQLVSGEGRLDLDLARAFPERVVNKGGAEAVLALGITEPPLGIAIKVLDGGARALGPILVETLKQLGLVRDLAEVPTLARHERPLLTNARGIAVGRLEPVFGLHGVSAKQ
jgi:L-asparaginase II